ncbi:MAG: uracil-DNA glycosylase [Rhizobiaceae bacterium]|nr:uracil-DNA glycosylase [Rhizobiaceae bacterium]
MTLLPEPSRDCALCPRLNGFISAQRRAQPDWHNAPVPVFSDAAARVRLLIVGLAPGLKGANRTGRPFTGDHAGELLYRMLITHGFAKGVYLARPDDGLALDRAAIINAVRCVPPQNKPTPEEINTCRQFLAPAFTAYPALSVVLTLGAIAHQSTVRALGERVAAHPFTHGGETRIGRLVVLSSYHCSRYNTNTGVLTEQMFNSMFERAAALCAG